MKNIFLITILFCFIVFSCKDEKIGQIPTDNVPPGKVTNVSVENISGGAIITYTLPEDEDLLYVKGVYSLKDGIQSEVKASLYTDTLKIQGFGDTIQQQVSLIAVDRSRNESEATKVIIKPLEAAVLKIGKTLRLIEDFGGLQAYWENPDREEISVVVLQQDHNDELVPIETFYSSVVNGNGAVRGLDTISRPFAVYALDRWENQSPIIIDTLSPLFEVQLDRLLFKGVNLPGDAKTAFGWVLPRLWDGIIGNQGFHSLDEGGSSDGWAHTFTIDLGEKVQISRIKTYQRSDRFYYSHGNIRKFEVWGSEAIDYSDGSFDNWTKLMDCESIKPSGLPVGQVSNEDIQYASQGEEFICSPDNPKVRYLRFRVHETWSGSLFIHISEIEVFGDNRF